jgi:hypothetical protein
MKDGSNPREYVTIKGLPLDIASLGVILSRLDGSATADEFVSAIRAEWPYLGEHAVPVALSAIQDPSSGIVLSGDVLRSDAGSHVRYIRTLDYKPARHRMSEAMSPTNQAPECDFPARRPRDVEYDADLVRGRRRERVSEQLARERRKSARDAAPLPTSVTLDELLSEPESPAVYRVNQLWPTGGRVLLAAQAKAGKTTLIGNLLRSLVDGDPFLGSFQPQPFKGTVVLIDNELSRDMVRRWLRLQNIRNSQRIVVWTLRGRLSSFDILDPEVRTEWAVQIRSADATVVIFDCLRPVLDALGLSEDKDVGKFLVAFDELLGEAGTAGEAVVVHHMGHSGERSRGDSRLRDWPEVEWKLVRENQDDPAASRYFCAYGRDVDVPEGRLEYESEGRRLTHTGGTRKTAGAERRTAELERLEPVVLAVVQEHPGKSQTAIVNLLIAKGYGRDQSRKAVQLAVVNGLVRTEPGARSAAMHFLAEPLAAAA